ncbi:twin-arginine translocation signal domain-containing protein [Dysgonomonas sp. GY75]|uniref:twin-arginine translocation signal domain-containing protein n=1 Tax=Dysgonomonas sp. GY75 TaxID=2780419 RepID=UPI0018832C53|nr:twin-arginine translocation signal domain-containing protein [Dysgonomonas sp. GY75]MBF0649986.1 twin-arginine translocation signal domain-containing protein [Dysgonomonas sp. GY75]
MEDISLDRRYFLKKTVLAGAAALFVSSPRLSVSSEVRYTLLHNPGKDMIF